MKNSFSAEIIDIVGSHMARLKEKPSDVIQLHPLKVRKRYIFFPPSVYLHYIELTPSRLCFVCYAEIRRGFGQMHRGNDK